MRSDAQFSLVVGARLGVAGHLLEQLRLAAELHEIGKIAVPDAILGEAGVLTNDEWRLARRQVLRRQGASGVRTAVCSTKCLLSIVSWPW
jgi:response regulator RpfG family c-di-GMP phosphodiesterase